MRQSDEKYSVRAVERAIDILQVFRFENQELTLAQICMELDLPKTTVFRILLTLEQRRLVIQDSQTGKYRLGYEMIRMGAIAQESSELGKTVREDMIQISRATGQTCNLYVREGYERVCIAQITGNGYVRRHSFLGARHPLYCGAGKLLLAYAEPTFQEEYFREIKLVHFTDRTVTSMEALKCDLEEIRSKGYSVTLGERDTTTAMVAIPLRDYTGKVIAALTISGPVDSFTEKNVAGYIDQLKKISGSIEKKLAYAEGF